MLKLKFYIFVFFLMINFKIGAQNTVTQNYEIDQIVTDSYFLNLQILENTIYIGSYSGLYTFSFQNGIKKIDPKIKGYISSTLEKEAFSNVKFSAKDSILLPADYRSNYLNSISFKNKKMIISRGKLFVFKQKKYFLNRYPSTRTISENYTGTYSGIFKDSKRIGSQKYTNGFIREFKNKTFLCYDGLVEIKKDTTLLQINFSMTLNDPKPISVRDISEFDKNEYLLFAENGLYLFNDLNNETKLFLKANKGPYQYFTTEYNFNTPYFIYFYDKFNYYKYEVKKQKLITLKQFDSEILYLSKDKNGFISKSFYVLFKNKNLKHFSINDFNQYESEILFKTSNLAHTIFCDKNYLFTMGDRGLDVYEFSSKKVKTNYIKDELNKNAFFIKNDTLKVGGIYGVYVLAKNDLDLKTYISEDIINITVKNYEYFILFGVIVLLLIYIFINSNTPKAEDKLLLEKIEAYVEENLKEVSVEALKIKFNITNHNLYKIMGDQKPGSYIRQKRLKLLKLLVKDKCSLEEISNKTGFSVSYLKKIV